MQRNADQPERPLPTGGGKVLQAAAVLATGAAALAFVAGSAAYLYIRFTQHRDGPSQGRGDAPANP